MKTLLLFQVLCGQYEVAPAVALESEAVREALRRKDWQAVETALAESF